MRDSAVRCWSIRTNPRTTDDGKGVLGIYVHNLKDSDGDQSSKGRNPFDDFTVGGKKLSNIVEAHDPPYSTSTYVYSYIEANLAGWIEAAIDIRDSND